ncbi:MAG: pyridoxal 5'-phosphate synthase glutaminase subunit PdxT [Spirochaetota bacterium]
MTVGVVAFQGDFQKHLDKLTDLGVDALPVRSVKALDRCNGVVVPGGESTTIGMLLERFGLLEWLRSHVREGFPVFGTCAGAILLANEIAGHEQPSIGGLDVTVKRNAYGRQIASFEADLAPEDGLSSALAEKVDGKPSLFHGVFIRAPRIVEVRGRVKRLLSFENDPVLVQEGNLLAATFHPELTDDTRLHAYFSDLVRSRS